MLTIIMLDGTDSNVFTVVYDHFCSFIFLAVDSDELLSIEQNKYSENCNNNVCAQFDFYGVINILDQTILRFTT